MSDPSNPTSAASLLEHASWVRALARRLAHDAAEAEDLAQQTLLAALEHRPDGLRPLRAWLGSVLRNLARQGRRREARRTARELQSARPEREPSASELVERASVQRRLLELVLELDERERTCVLLRYYEGLPPREVARRMDLPVRTVRSLLARALARLRAHLDKEHGGKSGMWLAAFLPLPAARSLSTSLVGALCMQAKLKIAVAALSVAGAALVWDAVREPASPLAAPPGEVVAGPARPGSSGSGSASVAGSPRPAPAERAEVPAAPVNAAAKPDLLPSAPAALRGRVLDMQGGTLANVRVSFRPDGPPGAGVLPTTATTAANGSFELPPPAASGALTIDEPGLATVLSAHYAGRPGPREAVVVVAPALDLAGVVLDERGFGLESAQLSIELPENLRSRIPAVLDNSQELEWRARSAVAGGFELLGVPAIEGARLRVKQNGFVPLLMELPTASDLALELVLRTPQAGADLVRGVVLDLAGAPAAGASVAYGIESRRTGPDGTFAFPRVDEAGLNQRFGVRPELLRAVLPGHLPAELACRKGPQGCEWPAWIVLQVGTPALALSGRVLDSRGQPLAGAQVWLGDTTTFGTGERGPVQIEALLAGVEERPWHHATTDAKGRFELQGLLPRDYTVCALDKASLQRVEREHVSAGSNGVELRMPADGVHERVAGRVLSHGGRPVEGVEVFPMCDSFRARVEGQIVSTYHVSAGATRTDAEGRFELRNVARSLAYLRVQGESILPLEYGRFVPGDPSYESVELRELPADRITELELRVVLRCHLQVELADPAGADQLAVLDARGKRMSISIFAGNSRRDGPLAPIEEGRTAVLSVPDTAHELVLYSKSVEVTRVPLQLEPGKLKAIKL